MYLTYNQKTRLEDIPKEFLNKENKWNYSITNSKNIEEIKLGDFKKINFLVGTNNSGKSRFLRGLLKTKEIVSHISIDKNGIEALLINLSEQLKTQSSNQLGNNIYNSFKSISVSSYFNLTKNYNKYNKLFDDILNEFEKVEKQYNSYTANSFRKKQYQKIYDLYYCAKRINDEILYVIENNPNEKKYIPILRSLLSNDYIKESSIKNTIKKNYDIEKNVYSGLELYDKVLKSKNSIKENKQKIENFEDFLSKHFFEGNTVELTSNLETEELLFSIDGIEHPVYEIGDGIQAIIILLFPVFIANKNDWFFIEEPETNLHPGLQRLFIETLLSDKYLKTKNLKFFFTTHSNHFLDSSLINNDISIFQFEKKQDESFFIKNNIKPDKEVLDLLGVNTSSVFLANTSLWVEGPTDRKYISKFLKLYCQEKGKQPLKEDIDFAFFEYGGNLIEHYLFNEKEDFDDLEIRDKINSFSLSNKIYLLADNDNVTPTSKKGVRRKTFEKISTENKNFTYQNTIVTEIENLLPKIIIQDFMSELLKTESSSIKAKKGRFNRDDYKNIGLGEFYENFFINKKIPKKDLRIFKSESGTLKNDYKIKLARFVIDSDYSYSDLIENNKELETIIEKLYSYISN